MFVSIVMAVYNGETYLQDAIDSILTQSYSNLEFIIVNDASIDETQNILNRISDKRVRILHLQNNKGAAHALNYGIAHAQGDWIAIQDADDISYPTRIEEQMNHINQNHNLVAVGSFIECINENNQSIKDIDKSRNSLLYHEEIKSSLYSGCPLTHGTMMFSKKAFYQAGQYNDNLRIAYDYDLWCRLIDYGRFENVPKILYKYRRYNQSLSEQNATRTSEELFSTFSAYLRKNNFSNLTTLPSFAVIGTPENIKAFSNVTNGNIIVKQDLFIDDYDSLLTAAKLLEKRKIDGIVILYKDKRMKKIYKSKRKRLSKYPDKLKNIFLFWSGI